MKKVICFIAFVLVYFSSVAQTFPQNPTNGQPQINNTNLGAGTFNRGVRGGVFTDTSAANDALYIKGTKFMQISTTSDNNSWYRSADTMRWELIATTTSNCAGTQLISGSITWSGSGLVYDATDLDYYILCTRYFANATTLTLSAADPTFPRIDKFYADNTGNIGVITGTPSANPQEPQINPLTQIDMGFVYIAAGATVPAGTTQTVIYNENVEWIGISDVPSINFSYGTNPYIGSVSTYVPSAPNSSYIEWQSGGTDYLFSNAQYLKFWVRLNDNFVSEPLSFLDVTFEYTDVTVSSTLAVGNGSYNMDYSIIDEWQLVSIPLSGITTYGTEFNEVHFVINSAPASFQIDYVYLLETATVPPVIGNYWGFGGNNVSSIINPRLGTTSDNDLTVIAGDSVAVVFPSGGITQSSDTSHKQLLWDSTTKRLYWGYQPTILADSPLVIYQDGFQDRIKADTSRRGAALATQYYADSVAGTGGATPGLNAVTLVDSTTEQGIKIATDTAVSLGQATLFADSWGAAYGLPDPDLGWFNLVCNWYGWEINNASLSSSTLMDRVIVDPFGATNMVDRIPLIPYYNTGSTVIGSKLLFAYGLNDVRWNGANYTTANFITDYTTVLDSAIGRGWSGSDIILISTGYLSPTSYVSYGGNPAATQTRQLQFDSCINVLATTYGAKYYDAYTFMYNNGGNALMQQDSIHPNTQGHKVYAIGFINNYNEPVRFGDQKLAVNGLAEFNSMKFTDFPTTSNENVYEVVLDSAGYLAVSTVQHVIYNEYGNVPIGFNAVDTPYKLAVDGSAYIGEGLNVVNANGSSIDKWLRFFSDYTTGASTIDAYTPLGAKTTLSINNNSRSNTIIGFLGTGASTISTGNFVNDSFYTRIMHPVITGYAPARVQGGNLMYFTGNGTIISSNSGASTFDNLSLQGFGGNTNVGKNGSATARLHIDAGTATASTAPLKFNAGTNLTTPEAGAVEFDGTDLFYTTSTPTRRTVANLDATQTFTNKTITSPVLSGTLTGSGTIGGSTIINTAGSITGFNIVATGLIRSAAGSTIEHNTRNKFTATSDGFETLTANSGTANTANLSVASLRTGYVAKTANYTATAFDETISCSTNAFTITLPTAVGCAGQKYNITNSTAANTITIATTSSQTFANVTATPTTLSLIGLGAVIVVSDGANWLQLK